MYISIPARDCSVAIGKAIIAGRQRLEQDKAKAAEQAYAALHGGAVHNGMNVTPARELEMREMVDRDVEHMLEQHPVNQTIKVLQLLERMLERNHDHLVTIDDADFSMLEEYLPELSPNVIEDRKINSIIEYQFAGVPGEIGATAVEDEMAVRR